VARRMSRRLVVISTAAIATVFSVGYVHTQPAEERLAAADSIITSSSTQVAGSTGGHTVQTTASEAATTSALFTLSPALPGDTQAPVASGPLAADGRRNERGGRGDGGFRQSLPAPTAVPAPVVTGTTAATVTANSTRYRDGSYTGMGENRHGDVQVTVTIAGGRIVGAPIAQCGMQYPCSRIAMLPGQVLARQSTDVDLVSGATMSSTAYQEAVLQALAKAAG
jgi:uncharacterized protein with FMN-binding domain/ribosomal protein S9